jgi:hypothetical protein
LRRGPRQLKRGIRTQWSKGGLTGKLQELNRLLPADSRELCKECVEGIPRLEMIEKRLDRDARTSEYRGAAHHLGGYLNDFREFGTRPHEFDSTPLSRVRLLDSSRQGIRSPVEQEAALRAGEAELVAVV